MILIILIVIIVGLFLLYHKQRDDKIKMESKLFIDKFIDRKLPLDTYEEELDKIFDYSKVRIVPLEGSIDGVEEEKTQSKEEIDEMVKKISDKF